ncbi:MAG: polyprenyl synthetase [Comamonadaceae bacterium PBBC2]|nr:MAG: polyprenyl synthetase [Comamonadaceae bacterium PBBC2]
MADEPVIHAMRYAVQGGKRLRGFMVLESARMLGIAESASVSAATAVEALHAYSLIHDDMPCMDNDDLRRGLPTVHKKWDEATAVLAGDALQTLAFELLTPQDGSVSPAVQAACVGLLARASGYQGMAGGQAIDLASVGHRLTEAQLRQMHRLKTGALLLCSVQMGAACGAAVSATAHAALQQFGEAMGLAFQVVDDILDVTADSATLGKTAGKDAAADKPTYVALMGLAPAQRLADELAAQAAQALQDTGLPTERLAALRALCDMVVQRTH